MDKFVNKLDKGHLRCAITAWALNTDGYEGAIGGILGEIPYSSEMNDVINWDDIRVHEALDRAIGKMYVFDNSKFSDWNCAKDVLEEFYSWVEQVADRVYYTYQDIIKMLNEEYEKQKKIIKRLDIGTYFVNINKEAVDHGHLYKVSSHNIYSDGFVAKDITAGYSVLFHEGINTDNFTIIPKS